MTNQADEDRIANLLLRWEEAFDHGQDLAAEELSADSSSFSNHWNSE